MVYKYIALFTTTIQLLLTGWLYMNFDPAIQLSADLIAEPVKFAVQVPWIDNFNIEYVYKVKCFDFLPQLTNITRET